MTAFPGSPCRDRWSRTSTANGGSPITASGRRSLTRCRRSSGADQRSRERGPLVPRDPLDSDGLQAHVVGAGVEVLASHGGDVLGGAVRDDRVDQAVRAALGDVGLVESMAAQVARVVAQAQVQL